MVVAIPELGGGWGGWVGVCAFMLAVLPDQPAQVTVLPKDMGVQGGEYCPYQEGPGVLPFLKGHSGQIRIVPKLTLLPLG